MQVRVEARRAVLGLGMMVATVLAQGQVQFYFSTPGGDTSRLTADDVDTFGWTGEYDVIVKNTSGSTIQFNSGCLMIGFAETTGEGPSASITPGSNKVTLLNMANAEAPPSSNPNFGTLPSWFSGSFGCLLGGGRGITGPTRPYGLSVTTDVALGTTQSIGAGQEFLLCRVKFADNGLFSAGGSHDLVLYDGGSTGSFTTALFRLPGSSYRPGANWYADSKLTLNAGGSNQPPVLDAIGDHEVREDRLLTFDASASDPDVGQTLTFSLNGAPYGAYINPTTGVFTWRPSAIQTTQTYTFDVVVSDNGNPVLSDIETITVTAERETRAATQVWAWGSNALGVAGLGPDNIAFPSPTPVPEFVGSSKILRGEYHTFARLSDGSWLATGWNQFGQLGDGTFDDRRTASAIPELSSFIDIGPGFDFSLGLTSSGTLFAWGAGDMGQLGSGVGDALPSPTQVLVIPNDSILRMMTSAYQTPFGITNTGDVYGFGYNQYGGLGTGSFPPPIEQLIPVLIMPMTTPVKIESSYYHSAALLANGTVMTWGRNHKGQLGDGTTINRAAPLPASISDVVDIDLGLETTYALKRDGTVWGWGWNATRLLGDGTTVNFRTTPVQALGLTDVVDIEACTNAVVALKSDGTVWVWGSNVSGILGNGGSPFQYSVPTQLSSLSNIAGIAAFADTAFAWSYEAGANQAPVLDPIGNQTVAEGSSLSLDANATDPDAGQTLTYSLTGAPSGMSIDGSTGVVSWTPSETQGPGSYQITIVVTDNGSPAQSDSEAITITVDEANQPPVLVNPGAQMANENSAFTLQLSGSDADLPAQSLTFAKVGGPSGLTVSPSGLVLWTPGESDGGTSPNVTVSLSDGVANVQQTFAISVAEVNQPPIVNGVVDRYGVMGTLFWLVLDVTDPDGPSTFTYSLGAGAPAGMTLDANGVLQWVPTASQVGPHTFSVVVTDNGLPVLSTTRLVTMRVASAGRVAGWGGWAQSFSTPLGQYVATACNVTGYGVILRPTGSLVQFGPGNQPIPPSGTFIGLSSASFACFAIRSVDRYLMAWGNDYLGLISGRYAGRILKVSSSTGGRAAVVTLDSPGRLFTWGGGQSMVPGKFLDVAAGWGHVTAIRSDGTLVTFGNIGPTPIGTFKAVAAGNGFSIAIRSDGTLVGWGNATMANVPAGNFVAVATGFHPSGINAVAVREDGELVSWGGGWLVPTGSFSAVGDGNWEYLAIRRNSPPTLVNPGPQSATEHSAFTLQHTGTDVETPTGLTYGLVSGPSGLTVSTSGLVSWTPGEAFGGTVQNVTVRVSDGIDTTTQTFPITVAEANGAPVCQNDVDTVARGTSKDIDVRANDTDPEGNSFLVTSVTPPAPNYGAVSIVSGGTKIRFTASSSPFFRNKITKFTYTVTDSLGATSSAQVQVTIK
ncbi:MAG: putative Ig domain-containing protein [Fimbriimonadaceae bacterium]|nr:putative Ig domain-containing protein [Fimbriimonadaceae bacterium]